MTQAQAAGLVAADVVERIIDAQAALLDAVIGQQLVDAQAVVPVSTRVELRQFHPRVRSRLKLALQAADEAVDLVAKGRICLLTGRPHAPG